MKTLEELMKEVMANEELKKAFKEALLNGTIVEFVDAQGVEATLEDIKEALLGEVTEQPVSAISDEEMNLVSGGAGNDWLKKDYICKVCGENVGRYVPRVTNHVEWCNLWFEKHGSKT